MTSPEANNPPIGPPPHLQCGALKADGTLCGALQSQDRNGVYVGRCRNCIDRITAEAWSKVDQQRAERRAKKAAQDKARSLSGKRPRGLHLHERMARSLGVTTAVARKAIRAFEEARTTYQASHRGHWSHAVDAGLEASAVVLTEGGFCTYGVESVNGQSFQDGDYEDPPSCLDCFFVYLNRGDTYAPTLGYDYERGRLTVNCWGDVVERLETTFGRRYEE